jgi:hypothetical protein
MNGNRCPSIPQGERLSVQFAKLFFRKPLKHCDFASLVLVLCPISIFTKMSFRTVSLSFRAEREIFWFSGLQDLSRSLP